MIKDFTFVNSKCESVQSHVRTLIARKRLEDILSLANQYSASGKKQRQICFFVRYFAFGAGYSKDASAELVSMVNNKFDVPLSPEKLKKAINGAEKGKEFYYSNNTIISELEIDGEDKNLQTIISDKERRRRKAKRDAERYRRRITESKRDKIKNRLKAMERKILEGTLERTTFQREWNVSKSTFYSDLKKAQMNAFRVLIICAKLFLTIDFSLQYTVMLYHVLALFFFCPKNFAYKSFFHREKEIIYLLKSKWDYG